VLPLLLLLLLLPLVRAHRVICESETHEPAPADSEKTIKNKVEPGRPHGGHLSLLHS
jgi:hypothetical protein